MADAKTWSYKDQLRKRLDTFIAEGPIRFSALYDFIYEVSLESYKNGLKAANQKSAPQKKDADSNEQELVVEQV